MDLREAHGNAGKPNLNERSAWLVQPDDKVNAGYL
jgi:hypothetical protein